MHPLDKHSTLASPLIPGNRCYLLPLAFCDNVAPVIHFLLCCLLELCVCQSSNPSDREKRSLVSLQLYLTRLPNLSRICILMMDSRRGSLAHVIVCSLLLLLLLTMLATFVHAICHPSCNECITTTSGVDVCISSASELLSS